MRRWRAGTVWLAMWATDGFFFHLDSTVFNVFLILQVGLDPVPVPTCDPARHRGDAPPEVMDQEIDLEEEQP